MSFLRLFFGYGVAVCGGGLLLVIFLGSIARDLLYYFFCRYGSSEFACLAASWTDEFFQMLPQVLVLTFVAGVFMGLLMWHFFGKGMNHIR